MIFEAIEKKTLKAFFDKHAPLVSPKVNWDIDDKGKLAQSVYDGLFGLKETDIETFQRVYPIFFDIQSLSERAKDGRYYRKKILGMSRYGGKWLSEFGHRVPDLHTIVAWIELNAPEVFGQLLRRKLMDSREASGGYKYYLPSNYKGEVDLNTVPFREEIKKFLHCETGLKMRAHIERNDLAGYIRFVITTDPFPKKEEQFKEGGGDDDIGMELAKRAERFYITVKFGTKRKCAYFSIKCDFYTAQRDFIADQFADKVLHSRLSVRPEQCRNLSGFRSRPKKFDFTSVPDYRSLAYTGMNMRINSGGERPEWYIRKFDEDFYDAIIRRGELRDVPDASKEIVEMYLDVTIVSGEPPKQIQSSLFESIPIDDGRKEKTFEVTVRSKGSWLAKPAPSVCDEEKIDRILSIMGLCDVAGEKILKTTE